MSSVEGRSHGFPFGTALLEIPFNTVGGGGGINLNPGECCSDMESQEGHKLALEWRGKRAKPHGDRAV